MAAMKKAMKAIFMKLKAMKAMKLQAMKKAVKAMKAMKLQDEKSKAIFMKKGMKA